MSSPSEPRVDKRGADQGASSETESPERATRRLHSPSRASTEQESIHQIVAIEQKDGTTSEAEIAVATADETEFIAYNDPIIKEELLHEFPKDKLQDGMNKEMGLMSEFDVADCVPTSSLTPEQIASALDFT